MKRGIWFLVSTIGLLATYYFRETLGQAFVWIVVGFVANLILAVSYYLQLKNDESAHRRGHEKDT